MPPRSLLELRERAIDHLWGDSGLPDNAVPLDIDLEIEDPIYPDLDNVAAVDRLVFDSGAGFRSVVDHYHPELGGLGLVVFHEGHCVCPGSPAVVQFFLTRGYSVLVYSMPMYGPNADTTVDYPPGRHNQLEDLEKLDPTLLRVFLTPVAQGINYATAQFGHEDVVMLGLSGGGWTTTLYTALDARVDRSFPVAGSLPYDLRRTGELGDFEQLPDRAIYDIVDYSQLYALGSAGTGRKQVQVLNQADPCCFHTYGRETEIRSYESSVQDEIAVSTLGGEFAVYIVRSHHGHEIADEALSMIDRELDEWRRAMRADGTRLVHERTMDF